jgi:hypothetical protein
MTCEQNAVALVLDLQINVTYECLMPVAMQDQVSKD